MFKIIVLIFFILHELVHLLWFVFPWRITDVVGLPYRTTILAGRVNVGGGGICFMGLLWLLGAVGFIIAGIGLLFSASWWLFVALGAALY